MLGTDNPADLMTKYLIAEVNERHCRRLDVQFTERRATTAPTIGRMTILKAVWEIDESHNLESDETKFMTDVANRLQTIVNDTWHKNWKSTVKMTCARQHTR